MIEADEIRQLLEAASIPMKAMILLGINCGFGQSDVANLEFRHIDLNTGMIAFPRPKTGIARRCPLWPETVAAVQAAMAARPEAKSAADKEIVFITRCFHRWVRVRIGKAGTPSPIDSVTVGFRKLLVALKMKRSGKRLQSPPCLSDCRRWGEGSTRHRHDYGPSVRGNGRSLSGTDRRRAAEGRGRCRTQLVVADERGIIYTTGRWE